jgi:hypothetical protein
LLVALVGASGPSGPRSAGGVRMLEAPESAPAALVGVLVEPRALDTSGHAAQLRVESSLVGSIPHGAVLQIGWEELAASGAPRFAAGERVLRRESAPARTRATRP